jgi:hypothetical protein
MLEPIITATIVAFVELTLHWFPWDLMLRRKLPRLAAYVLGVLGMMLPFTDCPLAGDWIRRVGSHRRMAG